MALRVAVTRLLSNSHKCAAVLSSRAQGTAAASPKGTTHTLQIAFYNVGNASKQDKTKKFDSFV